MSRRSGLLAVLSGLVLVGLVCGLAWFGLASSQALAGTSTDTWTGTWYRAEGGVAGDLILQQVGSTVTGSYTWNDGTGRVSGTVSGPTLTGGFNETLYQGSFVLTLSGKHFSGSYSGTNKKTSGPISGPFDGTCTAGPCLSNGAPSGGSVQVPQPAPGATQAVQSPKDLPATANTASVGVSSSSGNLAGDAVAAQGDTKKTIANGIAKFVVWCWLTADLRVDGKPLSPAAQFTACFYLSLELFPHPTLTPPSKPLPLAMQSGAVLSSAANRGCRELAIPIDVRTRKGKILSIGKDKHAKLNASSVRYTCSVSGGTAKITVKGRKHLRTSLGKRLHLLVVRAKKAPPATSTLTLTFGR